MSETRRAASTGRAAAAPSVVRWTALCAAAEAVGMTAAAAAAKASQALVGGPGSAPDVAVALSLAVGGGLVEGVALGVAQGAGLRRWLPGLDRRRWLLVTVAVAGLGWGAASAPAALAGDAGGAAPPWPLVVAGAGSLGAVMGAALGAAQALLLRGVVPHPWRWVATNAVAWPPAMVVIFLGASTPDADWSVPAVVGLGTATGLAAGAALGLVSGWFLPSLAGPPPHNRVVLAVLRSSAHRLLDRSVVALRIRGAVTGTRFELPVMYAADPAGLVIVPGRPETKRWWRSLRRPAAVEVLHRGRWLPATGVLLRPGDEGYADAVTAYRRRWPRVQLPGGGPVVRVRLRADRDAVTGASSRATPFPRPGDRRAADDAARRARPPG